jgi:hypothetical protein
MQARIDRPVTHFISPIAFLYQRHIPAIGSQVQTE